MDQQVYRGAQPTEEGFRYLAKLGVKVILDLRKKDDRARPHPSRSPRGRTVFVHCKRGADRACAVIAAYRIDHCKWDNQQALKEALAGGMRSLQFQRMEFIRTFQAR